MSVQHLVIAAVGLASLFIYLAAGCSSAPGACDTDVDLQDQPECREALYARCEQLASRADCEAEDLIEFNNVDAYCEWIDIVEFRDPDSCAHESTRQVCAATFSGNSEIACESGCSDSPTPPNRFVAISETELMYLPCARNGGPPSGTPLRVDNGTCNLLDVDQVQVPLCHCVSDACKVLGAVP